MGRSLSIDAWKLKLMRQSSLNADIWHDRAPLRSEHRMWPDHAQEASRLLTGDSMLLLIYSAQCSVDLLRLVAATQTLFFHVKGTSTYLSLSDHGRDIFRHVLRPGALES